MGPLIEAAQPADLPSVLNLVADCITHMRSQGIEQWDEIYPDEATLALDLQSQTLYLYRSEESLVGCAVLNTIQEPEYAAVPWTLRAEPVGVIHRLMIHPRTQGKGIARTFMKHMETRARELGIPTLRLDAFTENPRAVALYESLGYRRAGLVQFRKGAFYCFEKSVAEI